MADKQSRHHHHVKLLVVGDGAVGKTCLVISYTRGEQFVPREHVTTLFEQVDHIERVDGLEIAVSLNDTAGQEEHLALTESAFPATDVFLLTYAINDRQSFNHITTKWAPAIQNFKLKKDKDVRFILVAQKIDLRNDTSKIEEFKQQGIHLITTEEGNKVATTIRANAYFECSAWYGTGVKPLFQQAVKQALEKQGVLPIKSGQACCSIQ